MKIEEVKKYQICGTSLLISSLPFDVQALTGRFPYNVYQKEGT